MIWLKLLTVFCEHL